MFREWLRHAWFLQSMRIVSRVASSNGFCLEGGFKFAEAAFEFPLLLRFFAGLEESRARGGRFGCVGRVRSTGSSHASENVGLAPKAGSRKEIVFKAGADHLFQIRVAQGVGLGSADVFICQVDARDPFV